MVHKSVLPTPRVVWGHEAIGEIINATPERVRWLIGQGKLRVKKHGHRTVSALEHELLEDCAGEYQTENSES